MYEALVPIELCCIGREECWAGRPSTLHSHLPLGGGLLLELCKKTQFHLGVDFKISESDLLPNRNKLHNC